MHSDLAGRNNALDRVRTFLTLIVLLHHAALPYGYYGPNSATSWIGFDMIVLATDSFFMAMFFFLSGLFVWRGLERKTPLPYLRDRLLRLALPGLIGALVLIPFAYYSLALQQSPALSFSAFWWKTVTVGPWPSGPIWFLWVLLAFDSMVSGLYWFSPSVVFPINRISQMGFKRPANVWLLFAIVTEIAYLPLLLHYGESYWFEFGPFSLQASRALLYACYFLIGVGVGCANIERGILSPDGPLPKSRWRWTFVTLIFYALMWGMIFVKRGILDNPPVMPAGYFILKGTFFVLFSASILFAIYAFFLHAKSPRRNVLDFIQGEAYGMFLVHYPIVLWLQYFLIDSDWPAIAKGTTTFILTVLLSWVATVALRKVPGAQRVL